MIGPVPSLERISDNGDSDELAAEAENYLGDEPEQTWQLVGTDAALELARLYVEKQIWSRLFSRWQIVVASGGNLSEDRDLAHEKIDEFYAELS